MSCAHIAYRFDVTENVASAERLIIYLFFLQKLTYSVNFSLMSRERSLKRKRGAEFLIGNGTLQLHRSLYSCSTILEPVRGYTTILSLRTRE